MYLFASYVWDSEISQYHCYRRQYDPVLWRFTSRDPVAGSYEEPLTLQKYLYCGNDAINRTDPTGENYSGALMNAKRVADGLSTYYVGIAEGINASGGDPWAIMDVAIVMNNFKKAYFGSGSIASMPMLKPAGPSLGCIACMASVALSCGTLCAQNNFWDSSDDTWSDCTGKCMSFVVDPRKSFGPDSNIIIKGFVIGCAAACIFGI